LLDEPAEDVISLARAVINKLDELRADRPTYGVLVKTAGVFTVYGPYDTQNQAKKDVGKNIFAADATARGGVLKIVKASGGD